MNVRAIREEDIEQVIQLFRLNYGDDYSIPEFYDPQWVKRGIYSDHIIWLVIEDDNHIVASGACLLNFGDYNDQIGEIGRLVVDPRVGGKGYGGKLMESLIAATNHRVEFAFAEARTTHPKTQKILEHLGMVPLGFLPLYYRVSYRESWVLSGQLFGNGRALRHPDAVEVIPSVAPLAQLSLRNLELDDHVTIRDNAHGYPVEANLALQPLTGASLLRLLKIEQGRIVDPEIFSGLHVDQGISQLEAVKAQYYVASDGERTLGAIGYQYEEGNQWVRIIELIAQDNSVKGALLRFVIEKAEQEYQAELIEAEVIASSVAMQQTLYEMGFLPAAYVPGMVFHQTYRPDIVKMAKLNVPWDLGPLALTDRSREYFELIAPPFERALDQRMKILPALQASALFRQLTALDAYLVQHAGTEMNPDAGMSLDAHALHFVLAGSVRQGEKLFTAGNSVNAGILFGQTQATPFVAGNETRLLTLTRAQVDELCNRHPRLGVKLYQALAVDRT